MPDLPVSLFAGHGMRMNYPAYLVEFTVTGSTFYSDGAEIGFWLMDRNAEDADLPISSLFAQGNSGLLGSIATYISENGWAGGTVSDLTITKYTETTADATP